MRKHRNRVIGASLLALALLGAACGDSGDDAAEPVDETSAAPTTAPPPIEGPEIVIGAQEFGESAILAEIYQQALEAEGFTASVQSVGGFRDLSMAAFESGDINATAEYAASMLEFLNDFAGEATSDAAETTELLQGRLDEIGLVALEPSDAIDTNGFVITQETADATGIASLSDLAENGADLVLGGPTDCETNVFCLPGLNTVYGIDMSANFQPLEPGVVTADALEAGEIDVAVLFSTDAMIADRGLVLLEDDQQMLAADNVVPVITNELQDAYGDQLTGLLDEISAALTTEALTEMNARFVIETEDADVIAADWLADNGF